ATALVAPQPKVLLVESHPGDAARLRAALRPAGVLADLREATRLPTQLSELDAYEGIVLIDVPAGDLTLDQMATLREFVRSEGRGGGRRGGGGGARGGGRGGGAGGRAGGAGGPGARPAPAPPAAPAGHNADYSRSLDEHGQRAGCLQVRYGQRVGPAGDRIAS